MEDISGRYGTLCLISHKSGKAVSQFPVDVDVLTFGRDVSCDVRMYFVAVSPLHAKLVFEDYKPFLSVMGSKGAIVDGNLVLPSARSGEPSIVPLKNKSSFTIHTKQFRFDYPVNQTRPIVPTTPLPKARKSLRMSMINAARIMTPNTRVTPNSPSLETLQSPVKPYADAKSRAEREQEVILAEGSDVLVMKQGQDLIVTETLGDDERKNATKEEESDDNDTSAVLSPTTRSRAPTGSIPFPPGDPTTTTDLTSESSEYSIDENDIGGLPPAKTRSRSNSRISLHKAVLVRNSRLALLDHNDEEEVTRVVSPVRDVETASPYEEFEEDVDNELHEVEPTLDEKAALDRDKDYPLNPGDDQQHAEEDYANENINQHADGQELRPEDASQVSDDEDPEQDHTETELEAPRRSLSLRKSLEALGRIGSELFNRRWSAGAQPGDESGAGDNDNTDQPEDEVQVVEARSEDAPGATEAIPRSQCVQDGQEQLNDMDVSGDHEANTSEEADSSIDIPPDVPSQDVDRSTSPKPNMSAPALYTTPTHISSDNKPHVSNSSRLPRVFFTPQPPQRNYDVSRMSLGPSHRTGSMATPTGVERRKRFRSFGLPDAILKSTIADEDDEDVEIVMKNEESDMETSFGMQVPSVPDPITPEAPRLSTSTGIAPSTPLHSLREQVMLIARDNVQRANRLSYSYSPARRQPSTPHRMPLTARAQSTLEPIAGQRAAESDLGALEESDEDSDSSERRSLDADSEKFPHPSGNGRLSRSPSPLPHHHPRTPPSPSTTALFLPRNTTPLSEFSGRVLNTANVSTSTPRTGLLAAARGVPHTPPNSHVYVHNTTSNGPSLPTPSFRRTPEKFTPAYSSSANLLAVKHAQQNVPLQSLQPNDGALPIPAATTDKTDARNSEEAVFPEVEEEGPGQEQGPPTPKTPSPVQHRAQNGSHQTFEVSISPRLAATSPSKASKPASHGSKRIHQTSSENETKGPIPETKRRSTRPGSSGPNASTSKASDTRVASVTRVTRGGSAKGKGATLKIEEDVVDEQLVEETNQTSDDAPIMTQTRKSTRKAKAAQAVDQESSGSTPPPRSQKASRLPISNGRGRGSNAPVAAIRSARGRGARRGSGRGRGSTRTMTNDETSSTESDDKATDEEEPAPVASATRSATRGTSRPTPRQVGGAGRGSANSQKPSTPANQAGTSSRTLRTRSSSKK